MRHKAPIAWAILPILEVASVIVFGISGYNSHPGSHNTYPENSLRDELAQFQQTGHNMARGLKVRIIESDSRSGQRVSEMHAVLDRPVGMTSQNERGYMEAYVSPQATTRGMAGTVVFRSGGFDRASCAFNPDDPYPVFVSRGWNNSNQPTPPGYTTAHYYLSDARPSQTITLAGFDFVGCRNAKLVFKIDSPPPGQ